MFAAPFAYGAGFGGAYAPAFGGYGAYGPAGFGLGFERALMYATGIDNVRDAIPFPRTPNAAEF